MPVRREREAGPRESSRRARVAKDVESRGPVPQRRGHSFREARERGGVERARQEPLDAVGGVEERRCRTLVRGVQLRGERSPPPGAVEEVERLNTAQASRGEILGGVVPDVAEHRRVGGKPDPVRRRRRVSDEVFRRVEDDAEDRQAE